MTNPSLLPQQTMATVAEGLLLDALVAQSELVRELDRSYFLTLLRHAARRDEDRLAMDRLDTALTRNRAALRAIRRATK